VRGRLAWLAAGLVTACPPQPATEALDAAVLELDAGLDGGADAGAPLGAPQLTIACEPADGGAFTGLDAGATVDPLRAMTFTFPAALDDVRFRVMDWNDAVVPSDDEAFTEDGGYTYRMVFVQPLKPGRRYALLVDSETKDTFSDALGRQYDELRVPFRVSGDVQPEPGAPKKKKRRK